MTIEVDDIRAVIAAIDIGEDPDMSVLGAEDLPALPEFKPDVGQLITVGSQVAEFAKSVPVELRSAITNCMLLAQLAADRQVANREVGDEAWYNCYLAVMKKCGWIVERDESSFKWVMGNGAKVHQEIVQVLTAALGPGTGAVSIILGVVSGAATMQKQQPFFTIFDRASQHAEAQLFQISYVGGGPGMAPRMNFAAYQVHAEASATQVLFFKFAGSNAKIKSSSADLSVSENTLRQLDEIISSKVGGRLAGNVTEIQI